MSRCYLCHGDEPRHVPGCSRWKKNSDAEMLAQVLLSNPSCKGMTAGQVLLEFDDTLPSPLPERPTPEQALRIWKAYRAALAKRDASR